MASIVWTVGHSSRPLEVFLGLLERYGIRTVADVRRFPGSRRQPHYAQAALPRPLATAGIEYHWLPALGGRRKPRRDSPNTAWRNASFRGYADYIGTPAFEGGLQELLSLAARGPTAMMCAEAVWWRCHRALIADVLCARGLKVFHILDERQCVAHPLTSAARIVDGRLSYAAN